MEKRGGEIVQLRLQIIHRICQTDKLYNQQASVMSLDYFPCTETEKYKLKIAQHFVIQFTADILIFVKYNMKLSSSKCNKSKQSISIIY